MSLRIVLSLSGLLAILLFATMPGRPASAQDLLVGSGERGWRLPPNGTRAVSRTQPRRWNDLRGSRHIRGAVQSR